MQNAQNTEIQQRVINLVELYRTKVGKESQIAKDAKEEKAYWDDANLDAAIQLHEEGFKGPIGFAEIAPDMPEEWVNTLRVNDHLLGHFYSVVAGNKADKDVLSQFLAAYYDSSVFTADEEEFLRSHFTEMVNYIIQTPCDDLEDVNLHDGKDAFSIPNEVLELISSHVKMAPGSKVYYPNTAFAQLANLFEGSTFYVDTMFYAWTRVAIYANNVNAEKLDEGSTSQSYDAIVSYLPTISEDSKTISRICEAYNNLTHGGKLILLCPYELLAEDTNSSYRRTLTETLKFKDASFIQEELDTHKVAEDICAAFRRMLVEGQVIKEIVQLPQIMSSNASSSTYCLLIAEKGYEDDVTLIDARSASIDKDTKHYRKSFDMVKFNAILKNDGKDPDTGLRKVVRVSSENMSQDLLVPEVYTIERPSEIEHPVPLSNLCTLESALVRDVQYDLPEDTPWITMSDLTPLFTGDMDMSEVKKADCPNNPLFVGGSKDYAFGKDGKFVDSIWVQMNTKKGHHVLKYRQCTFLDGNTDAVLYERSDKHGVQVAVVRATGKPYAVSKGILIFCPKNGIDANSLAALLRLPVVYRQLAAYEKYGVGAHLDDVLAPTDKRVIGDELSRMKKEESVTNELGDKVQAMKTEYISEIRMRKHDMRPHMKQLNSAKNLMQYYVENMATTENVQDHLKQQLFRFQDALGHLSDIIAHLSDEEEFGEPEHFPIVEHLQTLVSEYSRMGYTINFKYNVDDVKDFLKLKIDEFINDIREPEKAKKYESKEGEYSFPILWSYAFISPLDFDRMIQNIIENARKHGFTDPARSDYKLWINLSVDKKREMYQIDFMNNGTPLPEGMTKDRFGIRGEKAGITGGTGSGGYIIKSIVNHYGGDYDVFSKDGITTVRINLPIATI